MNTCHEPAQCRAQTVNKRPLILTSVPFIVLESSMLGDLDRLTSLLLLPHSCLSLSNSSSNTQRLSLSLLSPTSLSMEAHIPPQAS